MFPLKKLAEHGRAALNAAAPSENSVPADLEISKNRQGGSLAAAAWVMTLGGSSWLITAVILAGRAKG
jgi:hypothetical protein